MNLPEKSTSAQSVARLCWPVGQWPDPDRAAWVVALTPGYPFTPGG